MPVSAENNSADPGLPNETVPSAVSDSFPFYALASVFQLNPLIQEQTSDLVGSCKILDAQCIPEYR